MELLWFSLKVMVIGMVVVFIGLIILIGAIKVLSAVMERIEGHKKAPEANAAVPAPAAAAPMAAPAAPAVPAQDDLALVAVIMAAILAGEQPWRRQDVGGALRAQAGRQRLGQRGTPPAAGSLMTIDRL